MQTACDALVRIQQFTPLENVCRISIDARLKSREQSANSSTDRLAIRWELAIDFHILTLYGNGNWHG